MCLSRGRGRPSASEHAALITGIIHDDDFECDVEMPRERERERVESGEQA